MRSAAGDEPRHRRMLDEGNAFDLRPGQLVDGRGVVGQETGIAGAALGVEEGAVPKDGSVRGRGVVSSALPV